MKARYPHRGRGSLVLAALALAFSWGHEARANVSGMWELDGSGSGGLVTLRSDAQVSLLHVKVELDVYYHHTWGQVSYLLENTGPDTEVLLGFPAFQVHDLAGKPDRAFVLYKIKVDGKVLPTEIRKGPTLSFAQVVKEFFPRLARAGKRIELFDWVFGYYNKFGWGGVWTVRERLWTPRYYVSRAHFTSGQKRRLEIVFLDRNLVAMTGNTHKGDFYYPAWHMASYTYLASPARTWKGLIGRAELRLRLPFDETPGVKVPTLVHPEPHVRQGKQLSWTYSSWKPEENLHVAIPAPVPVGDHGNATLYAGKLRRQELRSFLETVGTVLARSEMETVSAPIFGSLDATALGGLVEGDGSRVFQVKVPPTDRSATIHLRLATPRCLTRVVTVTDRSVEPAILKVDGHPLELLEPEHRKYLPLDSWREERAIGEEKDPPCQPKRSYYDGKPTCEWQYEMLARTHPLAKPVRAKEISVSFTPTRKDREAPISTIALVSDARACPEERPAAAAQPKSTPMSSSMKPAKRRTRGSARPGCGCAPSPSAAAGWGPLGMLILLVLVKIRWKR